jgi:hypothetical protein
MTKTKKISLLLIVFALSNVEASVKKTHKEIDPKADKILHRMTDYLAGLKTFSVNNSIVDEIVTKDGQKIQMAADLKVLINRPDQMKSEKISADTDGGGNLLFVDDGKEMTLYCKSNNTYATLKSPPNLDATIEEIRTKHNIDAPGADLLFSKSYDVLTEQVTSGQYIGPETINGISTHHLAFKGEEVDWQIWIQDGNEPLPMRYVITTKTVKNHPEFTVNFSNWHSKEKVGAYDFKFVPASGAKKVNEFPSSCL